MRESAVYFRVVELREVLESGTCEVRESDEVLIRELQ
jgi:hypothetical protein